MFIETSAFVAILAEEPEADTYLSAIDGATRRQTGAHVRLEATINLAHMPILFKGRDFAETDLRSALSRES